MLSCIYDDKLINALLWGRLLINPRICDESTAIPTQLMLMMSTICSYLKLWNRLASEVPTLLTNMQMSKGYNSLISVLNLVLSEEYLKSNAIVLNSALLFLGLYFLRF